MTATFPGRTGLSGRTGDAIALADRFGTANYAPLPVVLSEGTGAWVTDVDGRRYLDALAGYSALNFGHRHPVLVEAAHRQLESLTLTARAFHNDRLPGFQQQLAELTGTEAVLPMNTGAEAVESAIKVARAWGYRVRGVRPGAARIVVAGGNFHGRTTTVVSFSDDPDARTDFGPFTPGFDRVPYGDAAALAAALTEDTVAVLLEPVQGEAGVIVPPEGYLAEVRRLTAERDVLLVCDEIQSGLGRAGATLCSDLSGVRADLYTLGKALGGGVLPVSAVVGRRDVLGVLRPGEHGSTFGGNPLAAAVGSAVCGLLGTGELQAAARDLGRRAGERLAGLPGLTAVRGAGLWFGVDVDPAVGTGREVCVELARRGVLAKETHGSTVRLSPPLVVTREEVDLLVDTLGATLEHLAP
ncbi:ornithine--oxo-acid transaminase [Pseudonocardia sp. HH130630-07]|uniref:ornithine--oxo-acid transaminase n=1 Tax=Pseudonocardia sp. HH130630-07 TaxID=1690815 RepID=UPI000814EA2A|nr:ornithine--oxo-acid transaminase [Pseudonocardia sp. HH130630-07]ANY07252.1 ornithine--oxo-acid aminotransferase [Pseudonocardia sp. HH130630-07]